VQASKAIFDKVYESVRTVTLRVFAEDDSASVQATMYKMSMEILSKNKEVLQISYVLPNKHYFMIPMDYIGEKNTGKDAEVYRPEAYPAGYITASFSQQKSKI